MYSPETVEIALRAIDGGVQRQGGRRARGGLEVGRGQVGGGPRPARPPGG